MSNRKKSILCAVVSIPIVVFFAGVGIIYFKQDKISREVVQSLNETFKGRLEIDAISLSPFASFPYISIEGKGIRFFEEKNASSCPLYQAEEIYIGFDIFNVLFGDLAIKSLKVKNGHLDLIKDQTGNINLLEAKQLNEENTSSGEGSIEVDLQEVSLSNMRLAYLDLLDSTKVEVQVEQLKGSISLMENHYSLGVESKVILDYSQAGQASFFYQKPVNLDWQMDFDQTKSLLTILPSKLELQGAQFSLDGTVDFDKDFFTDLKIYGEKPDFSLFAAFAPETIGETLKKYDSEGQIYFLGTIKGKAASGHFPLVSVEFGCENAYFVNPSADKKVDELNFSGFFTNGAERNLKTSEFRLQQFYAKPDEGVFDGQLVIRNFEDPYIKAKLKTELDLEFIGDFFEIEGLRQLKGKIKLDMDLDEIMDMNEPNLSLTKLKEGMDSELTIQNLSFNIPGYPLPVTEANGHAIMKDGMVSLHNLSFLLGKSDFNFDGELSDFTSLFHGFDENISFGFSASSNEINLPELLSFDSSLMAPSGEIINDLKMKVAFHTNARKLKQFTYLPEGNFEVLDFYAKLKHYPHVFHDFDAKVSISENDLEVNDFTGEIDGSDFHFSGLLQHYPKWFQPVKKGLSQFTFDLSSNHFKIKDLLTYNGVNYLPEDYLEEELKDFSLEGNLDLWYDTTFRAADLRLSHLDAKLNLHPLKIDDFSGKLHFEAGKLNIQDFGGKMGESDFRIDMNYYIGADSLQSEHSNTFDLRAASLDLDALMAYDPNEKDPKSHEDTFNIFDLPFSDMIFTADIKKMNYHTFWLENVKASMRSSRDHYLYVDSLSLQTADGTMGMKGYFNGSDPKHIYFHSNLTADRLDIDKLMIKFDNFGQDLMINENLHGKVSGTITSKFLVHPDLTPIIEKSEAHMDLTVIQGSLVNFTPLQAMSSYFKDKNLNLVRFDTLQNTFDIKDGMLLIPNMTVNSSLGFIELSGRQGLDLSMDYFIRVPLGMVTQVGFRSLFGGRNKNEINPDQEDDIVYRDENKKVRFVNLHVKGTPEDYQFSLGKNKE